MSGLRRVFLVGCPRSRTTVSQTVIAQACDLATMASTNWYLEHASTQLLNGPEGMARADARQWAHERITTHLFNTAGITLPDGFRLEDALDQLAAATGTAGWLEKTPLNVLAIPEIEADIPRAHFIHLIREPAAVITSLLRRARDNPGMIGARQQSDQKNNEAVWRTCIQATLEQHGKVNHLVVDSDAFVDNPEAQALRVATFLGLSYRPPEHPARIQTTRASTPSERPWKKDAAGPVRRIQHEDDIALKTLDTETETLWAQTQQQLTLGAGRGRTPFSPSNRPLPK